MCVARKALRDRTVPTDAMNLALAAHWRKALCDGWIAGRTLVGPAWRDDLQQVKRVDQRALSIIWVS